MSNLVIVESPAKAKTIQKYLGKGYDVIASMGHVRDLPENRLSVDVKKHFQPKYTVIKGISGTCQSQSLVWILKTTSSQSMWI